MLNVIKSLIICWRRPIETSIFKEITLYEEFPVLLAPLK